MSYNMEGIINPRDLLPGLIKEVLPLYVKDYGVEYTNLILRRLYDAVYIFDSNPIETWAFVSKYKNEINDPVFEARSYREYKDYMYYDQKVNWKNEKILRRFLKKEFQIPVSGDYSFMTIDFNSYSVESIHKLQNGTEEEKKSIRDRQAMYRQQCRLAGFNPITLPNLASEIANLQEQLLEQKKYYLADHTKWANRVKSEIHDIHHFDIGLNTLKECLFDEEIAFTTVDKDKNGFHTIMTFPIIHNFGKTSLDHVLFHELRHVVETGKDSCGFFKLKNGKYQLINEIHTEKNALLDEARLSHYIFLGNSRRFHKCYYERFFQYLGSLFEDYKMSFDLFAFTNRTDLIERLFGERFLNDLEYKLHNEDEFKKENKIRLKRNA